MNTVIGILPSSCNFSREIEILKFIGFNEEDIHLVTQEKLLRKLLKFELAYLIKKYIFMGAAIGLIISLSIICILFAWDVNNRVEFNKTLASTIIVLTAIFGTAAGAIIGLLIGKSKYKNDIDLFIKSFRNGDIVIEVHTTTGGIDQAKFILNHGCATCVRAL